MVVKPKALSYIVNLKEMKLLCENPLHNKSLLIDSIRYAPCMSLGITQMGEEVEIQIRSGV